MTYSKRKLMGISSKSVDRIPITPAPRPIVYYNYNILYYFNEMEMKKIALEINQGKTNTAIDF